MDFGWALNELRMKRKVARSGWNGKNMWLRLIDYYDYNINYDNDLGPLTKLPWIGMKTADMGFVPWLASQTDLLAQDWNSAY